MTLYLYGLVNIFGQSTYIVAQIINIFAILVAFYSIYKIISIIYEDRNISKVTLITLFLFIPISMYITFIYGNLLGFACSMLALNLEFIHLKTEKKRLIIPIAILISLAILFKSNYMITMIAMIILFIEEIIFKKKIKFIVPILAIIVIYFFSGTAQDFIIEKISGKSINEGTPMTSYIAMGMQESKMAPGWYNGYTQKIYKKSKYDLKLTNEKINTDITNSIEKFKSDPKYALDFYSQKVSSQWNNPDFQSFWIHEKRKSDIPKQKIVKSVLGTGKVNKLIKIYMNIMQTAILFGAVMYIILNYKKINLKELTFGIIFIGGFIFHLIWEAKAQYTITYFILLIPYAVLGYFKIVEKSIFYYNKYIKKLKYLESKDIIIKTEE